MRHPERAAVAGVCGDASQPARVERRTPRSRWESRLATPASRAALHGAWHGARYGAHPWVVAGHDRKMGTRAQAMAKKTADKFDGTGLVPVSAGDGTSARTRHLRPGDPDFGRVRRPPLPERVGSLAAAVLGEERGALVYAIIAGIKRKSIPAAAGKLVLERLLPPGRPIRLDLPAIRTAEDMVDAHDLIVAAMNRGDITAAEARELQDVVAQAWHARKEAERAPPDLRHGIDPEERQAAGRKGGDIYRHGLA